MRRLRLIVLLSAVMVSASVSRGWIPEARAESGLVFIRQSEPWEKAKKLSQEPLQPKYEKLKVLYKLKRPPGADDWLLSHREPTQTFADFVRSSPDKPGGDSRRIVIQPLGELGPGQLRVVKLVADYMERFFGLPIRVAKPIPSSAIPASARRIHPTFGVPQVSTIGAAKILEPRRPSDAFAYLAFTGEDLFPDPKWNFVFGEAFPEDRIGIWSLARYGNPNSSAEAFHTCLKRAMNVAVHEMTHLLGVQHCQAFECVMNGSNSLTESDANSTFLCPVCMQKLAWSTHVDPVARMRRLREFYVANGFGDEAKFAGENLKLWNAAE